MAVSIDALLSLANAVMKPEEFSDYCPNGLQVSGSEHVDKIVAGVTASQALIERAIDEQADVLLVHHGFFWKGEDPRIVGLKFKRIKRLIEHNINLIAYHLPLDAHPELGNNAQLAKLLGIEVSGGLESGNPRSVGNIGRLAEPLAAQAFCERVSQVLQREPLLIEAGSHLIETIGWCTGAAQGYIENAAELGMDAYLSGEISEPTTHSAREHGLHYIAAGHHATERYGVKALGEYLAGQLDIHCQFIDVDNPV